MSFPITFDDSLLQTDAPASRVPEGIYKLKVGSTKVDEKDDEFRFKTAFNVVEGPVGHGTLGSTFTLREGIFFGLGRFLQATGFDVTRLAEKKINNEADLEKVRALIEKETKGKTVAALVADSKPSQKGKIYSNIDSFYPEEEFEEQSASVNFAPAHTASTNVPSNEQIEDLAKTLDTDW